MAFDAFLKIATIPGECTDSGHEDWIEILSYDHGVTQPTSGSVSSGGSRSAERVDHEEYSILKGIDKATPKLLLACCNGEHIPEISIEICRSGKDKQKYYEVVMNDVMVKSVTAQGRAKGAGSAPLPVETVLFAYGKIKWTYTETDHLSGATKGNVEAAWDLHTNTGA